MDLLARYAFVDCLLVDLELAPRLTSVSIVCEAVGPLAPGESVRRKGLLEIRCEKIHEVSAVIDPALSSDLGRPYDPAGEDVRANEILALTLVQGEEGRSILTLRADLIRLRVDAGSITATEPASSERRRRRPG